MAKALGKGLEALIPGWTPQQQTSSSTQTIEKNGYITELDINLIKPSITQPRTHFNDERLQELSQSIKEKGIIQPLVVVKNKNNEEYSLIAGERRYRASKLAGLEKVPVIIKNYHENERFEIALLENIQRENLNPIEEAVAYQYLMRSHNLNQEELSSKIKKNRSTIANALRILNLPESIHKEILDGKISQSQARTLASLPDEKQQFEMLNKIKNEGLNIREIEDLVRQAKNKNVRISAHKDPDIIKVEQELRERLGTKVQISSKGTGKNIKGSIKINFNSLEDAQRILGIIID